MKIMAIDTTENTATAAICEDAALLASYRLTRTRTHSESMLPMIESMLHQLACSLDEIDLFAISAGPGSFTGVRIGAATIKGLTFGREKPIVAVSALEAMAWNHLGWEGIVAPCMDARRNQLYNALFRIHGETVERLTPDRIVQASELAEELSQHFSGEPIRFTGGGMEVALKAAGGKVQAAFVPEVLRYEDAYGVALCALHRYLADPACALTDITLAPTYLRASQAEQERLRREEQKQN